MKVKLLLKYIACSFNVLLLSSTFQVVRADQNNECSSVNSGSTCVNNGFINNTTTINYIYNYPINRHTGSVFPTFPAVLQQPMHQGNTLQPRLTSPEEPQKDSPITLQPRLTLP